MNMMEFIEIFMGLSDEAIGQIEDFLTKCGKQSDSPESNSHSSDKTP